jgi:hypothetical protein
MYISTRHVEKCTGFILVNMEFHKLKHCLAKHALGFGISIFNFKITGIKSCYYKEFKEKFIYIDSACRISRVL